MPCTVTAFSVKIASLGDAAMELIMAREIVCEWNELHGLQQNRILLPLHNVGSNKSSPYDLLIVFYRASQGTPGNSETCGTSAEIDRQIEAGRPVLIYFSEARADFAGTNTLGEQELKELNAQYASRALIESYGDEKEFRAKFARHLEVTISTHAHFQDSPAAAVEAKALAPATAPVPAQPKAEEKLSELAQTLLTEACEDFEAYIGRIKIGTTLKIQANGKQLVEQGNAEAAAKWESAFQELLSGAYIRDAGCNGQLFQISSKGFTFLKSIGKTPVGYIAELGGM